MNNRDATEQQTIWRGEYYGLSGKTGLVSAASFLTKHIYIAGWEKRG